jgi:hypothetical protein
MNKKYRVINEEEKPFWETYYHAELWGIELVEEIVRQHYRKHPKNKEIVAILMDVERLANQKSKYLTNYDYHQFNQ